MPKVKRANIPKMKQQPKVKVVVPRYEQRVRKLEQPIIRNKDFALERALFKAIRPGLQQTKLEESLKNNDYAEYNKLLEIKKDQDERIRIDKILKAITILKQKFTEARNKVQDYDPTLDVVKKVEGESDQLIKTLDNRFNEIIQIRGRLDKLNEQDKRIINNIDREIERYAVDLEKVSGLTKRLDDKNKVTKEEKALIETKREFREVSAKIQEDLKTIFTFDLENTKVEQSRIKEELAKVKTAPLVLETAKRILKDETSEEVSKLRSLLTNLVVKKDYLSHLSGYIKDDDSLKRRINRFNELQKVSTKAFHVLENPELKNFNDIIQAVNMSNLLKDYYAAGKELDKDFSKLSNSIVREDVKGVGYETYEEILASLEKINNNYNLMRETVQYYDSVFNSILNGLLDDKTKEDLGLDKNYTGNKILKDNVGNKYNFKINIRYTNNQILKYPNEYDVFKMGKLNELDFKRKHTNKELLLAYNYFNKKVQYDIDIAQGVFLNNLEKEKENIKRGFHVGAIEELKRLKGMENSIDDDGYITALSLTIDITQISSFLKMRTVTKKLLNTKSLKNKLELGAEERKKKGEKVEELDVLSDIESDSDLEVDLSD